jgi:2-polyprenyl-3-methyl-5-hydroxy-6-metoxy-1,4-benzoquinol methylase
MSDPVELYNSSYGNFFSEVLQQVRIESFGEDIGQNSWLTADEYLKFISWLKLKPDSNVLEAACGSGGPALFMARKTGCNITGIDNNKNGIETAGKMALEQGLASRVRFQSADAAKPLQFDNSVFDAVVCIDAINHLPNRQQVLNEWHRVLKPEGRILFTDPITVTGILTAEEIAKRSSIGYFLFVPDGENERLLKKAGFNLILKGDATANVARVSKKWRDARAKHKDDLIKLEGAKTYEGQQEFLSTVYMLSSERRLSRFVFVADK